MKYVITLAIISLILLTTARCRQYSIMNLISRLNDCFHFDHNIFLLNSEIDNNISISIPTKDKKFKAQTVYSFYHSLNNSNGTHQLKSLTEVTSKNPFLIVLTESLGLGNNSQLLTQVKRIQGFAVNMKIGVFIHNNITSIDIVKQLFGWSRSAGILNIFCAFYSTIDDAASLLSVLRYDSVDFYFFINVTGSGSVQHYFPDKVPNFRKLPVRISDTSEEDWIYYARFPYLEFWKIILRVSNASLSMRENETVYGSAFARITHLKFAKQYVFYPHRRYWDVLMVPHARPHPSIVAFLQSKTWKLLLAYFFFVIVTASILLTISIYLHTQKISVFQCVADVINLFLNNNAAIRYRQLHLADVCVVLPLTFIGLIVMNGILSFFQTFLTLPIYERQINTLEDLFKSTVRIAAGDKHDAKLMIEYLQYLKPQCGAWTEKVYYSRDYSEILDEIYKFNTSLNIAWYTFNEDAARLLKVQTQLGLKAFHAITESIEKPQLIVFKKNPDFPFVEHINDLIHRLHAAGLFDEWEKRSKESAIPILREENRELLLKTSNELNGGELTVPAIVWYGWIASVIVFIFEIIWKKIQPPIEKLKQKLSKKSND